ncbi:ABC transporter G family member 25 [Acorus calamus]|uniref:ABC transporter G family member 25 n=1 Tax=Acorus calamus TaxID=4465 RepID=A0AAV9FAX7_ACOCL|nr:ABC transporter G family member 25 [Acorus calamus]
MTEQVELTHPSKPTTTHSSMEDSILSSPTFPISLKFVDLTYKVKLAPPHKGGGVFRSTSAASTTHQERTILNNVSGAASPGEITAVLGPSGSGKSTLLNALVGRLHPTPHASLSGSITANDGASKPSALRRRTGYVAQEDLLYPHLTVRESLVFCALLRLPRALTSDAKRRAAEAVIAELGLGKCADTLIGSVFVRGVSGGERKRVSIGQEMLVGPSLLVLDEPTSGLDSTAAHRLVLTMHGLARKGMTVVMSIHQPSSRVYQVFDAVILLSEGCCMYYGRGQDAMDYFASVGFAPRFPVNPADFMLDLANGVAQVDYQIDADKSNMKQSLVASYNKFLAPRFKACISDKTEVEDDVHTGRQTPQDQQDPINHYSIRWTDQFAILLRRSLKERRHEAFNYLRVTQVMAAAVLAGLMWWRNDIRDVRDRLGLLFFFSIFWGVFPSFNAVFTFPQERAILGKERSSSMYSLSSYYLARTAGDLPMELVLPTVFIFITYWMAGLRPEPEAFLLTLLVILGYVMVAQGLGLAVGAAMMDAKRASTLVTVIQLAFLLTAGFYVEKIPLCMGWLKYASFTYYCFRLLIGIQYGGREGRFVLGRFNHGGSEEGEAMFGEVEGTSGVVVSVAALAVMFVGYRLLAYALLRRLKV